MYEGQDYSNPSEQDRRTFDQILAGMCGHTLLSRGYCVYCTAEQLRLIDEEEGEERILRSERRVAIQCEEASFSRKRKPLTPQQLEERRKKVSVVT